MPPIPSSKKSFSENILIIYLYLVSAIALVVFAINCGRLVHMALETWVFPIDQGVENSWEIDQCEAYGSLNDIAVEKGENYQKPTQAEIDACLDRAEETAERREHNDRQRTLASSLAFILVSLPLWVFHYRRALKLKK